MATTNKTIEQRKEILGGTPVFKGTRVPVNTFLEYLEAGHSISEFLEDFPTVSKEQAIQAAFFDLTIFEISDFQRNDLLLKDRKSLHR